MKTKCFRFDWASVSLLLTLILLSPTLSFAQSPALRAFSTNTKSAIVRGDDKIAFVRARDSRPQTMIYSDGTERRRPASDSGVNLLTAAVSTGPATTVTNTNDSGPGSLRAALAATLAGGTVNFALSGCPCTILLTTGDLEITKDLTVIGPGAGQLTINGNNAWRPLRIGAPYMIPTPPPVITVVLDGLRLTNGLAGPWPYFSGLDGHGGGIISVDTNLTIRNSIIANNLAPAYGGGISSVLSNTTVINSIISGNLSAYGGGISHIDNSPLSIIGTTISDNQAMGGFSNGVGGGIYSNFFTGNQIIKSTIVRNRAGFGSAAYIFQWSTVEISDSTIEGNTSGRIGGTLVIQITTASITNSTISGNTSGGSYYNAGINHENFFLDYPDMPIHSQLTITNTTINDNRGTGDGGGIITYQEQGYPATTTVRNSIVAGNTPNPNGTDLRSENGGVFASSGYNLIGNAASITVFNQPGDQAGTPSAPIDPRLEALAFNGGPTKTHALKFDSPALDRGFGFGSSTDQRGVGRPVDDPSIPNAPGGDGSDIGAFDGGQPGSNPIDFSEVFIRQHYLDFLNRPGDPGGVAYWTDQITQCGNDAACVHNRRIDVSAAFFHSLEFQQTGSFVYGLYKGALGRQPTYPEFTADHNRVIGGTNLDDEKAALANDFVQRPEFLQHYPGSLTNAQFVNTLFDTAGLFPFTAERQAEIDAMNNQGRTRAQVLRNVIDIQAFRDREFNPSFVLMQYFGYMRRDIDPGGYAFWLIVLNSTNDYRGMVCAFITSSEYQLRFGAVTRSNADCN